MAQKNTGVKTQIGIRPAASGSGGATAKKLETKKTSNAGIFGKKVGPARAPYYQK